MRNKVQIKYRCHNCNEISKDNLTVCFMNSQTFQWRIFCPSCMDENETIALEYHKYRKFLAFFARDCRDWEGFMNFVRIPMLKEQMLSRDLDSLAEMIICKDDVPEV